MTGGRLQVIPVGVFPVLLATGILTIPVVSDYSHHALAAQAAAQTGRWFWGHVISAVAFAFAILAACSIAGYLSTKGQGRLGMASLLLIAVGGTLYAAGLGADGIGPLATVAGGGQAQTFFEGSGMWVSGVFIAASITFGLGLIAQVITVLRVGLLKGTMGIPVFIAAVVFVGAGAIPSGWGLWAVAAAALAVYLPIALALWRQTGGEE